MQKMGVDHAKKKKNRILCITNAKNGREQILIPVINGFIIANLFFYTTVVN